MDHGLTIENRVRADLLRIAKDLQLPLVATNDLHYAHASRRRRATRCCSASSPARRWPTPTGSSSTGTATTSSRRPRCGRCSPSCPRPATTRSPSPSAATSPSPRATAPSCRATPARRGRPRTPGSSRRSRPACGARYPERDPRRGPQAGRVRDRGHHLDGLRRLLPGRRRLHQLGQGERHPGRARAAARAPGSMAAYAMRITDLDPLRARADLRAVPQPRPGVDARLRHRLRRASARRGDPLRHREVRRRPGQPDRHLRHDQGQAGGQGRLPGARLPVRRWASGSPRRCRRR